MGKISKYSNLYDNDGNLLRHVNDKGVLEKYTVEELKELLKTYEEDGKITDQVKYNNVMSILIAMGAETKNGNIFKNIGSSSHYSTSTEVDNALNDIKETLDGVPIDAEAQAFGLPIDL